MDRPAQDQPPSKRKPIPATGFQRSDLHIRGLTQVITQRFYTGAGDFSLVYRRTGVRGLSMQVAFSFLMALPPSLLLVIALATISERFLNMSVSSYLTHLITSYAPEGAQELLLDSVSQALARFRSSTALVSAGVAFALALWGGMTGIGSLVDASNRAYGVLETRPFFRRRLRVALMAVVMPVLLVAAIVAVLFTTRARGEIGRLLGNSEATSIVWTIGSVIFAWVALALVLLMIYQLAPNVKHSVRWTLPGAALGATGLLLTLFLARFILSIIHLGNAYGAAGGVVILLYLFRVSGYIFVDCAILNGVLGARHDMVRRIDLLQHPEKQLFDPNGFEISPTPDPVTRRVFLAHEHHNEPPKKQVDTLG